MPTFLLIEGIKILCYFGEHLPPHVHVVYNEYEVLIEIESLGVYSGYMPVKKLNKAKELIRTHQEDLLFLFNALNPQLRKRTS